MHINNGKCSKCTEVFNKYPNFNQSLQNWFISFQSAHPEAHVSCAGRGKSDQETYFRQGKSKAQWGQSAHNVNLALDCFKLGINGADFSTDFYVHVLGPEAKKAGFEWAGDWSNFRELVHVQLSNWKDLVSSGEAKLVE